MHLLNNKKVIRERLQNGIRESNGCHIWQLHETVQGYGYMGISGCIFAVRRIAWWLRHGYLPKGSCMRDTCGNKLCCNPDHLRDNTPEKERRTGLLREGTIPQMDWTEDEEDRLWEEVEINGGTLYREAKKKGVSWKSAKKALARAKLRIESE